MTREQAYERLELPVGTDLQQVRRKFQQMHNDFQMRIDNAPTPKLRQAFERGMEEIKQAYALLNESSGADDMASLPRTERTFAPSEEPRTASVPPPSREEQSLRPEPPTMDEALAIFGLSPADSAQNATEKVERHIAELRRMHDAAAIPGIRDAYRSEIEKSEQARPIAERWITDRRGQEQQVQWPAEVHVPPSPPAVPASAPGGKPKNRTPLYAGIGAAAALLLAGIYFAVLRNGNNGQDLIPPKTDTIARQETADPAPETKNKKKADASEKPEKTATTEPVETVPGIENVALSNTWTVEGNDQMKFDTDLIRVKAGEPVDLHFKNVGKLPKESMGHNFIVLKPGTDVATFGREAVSAADNDYIPKTSMSSIIVHTKLLGPGEEDTITFTLEKGVYPYLCSFPGHFGIMQGKIVAE